MEINRLKPMKDGYPKDLFNKIYSETKPLRKKLSYSINERYYGVSRDIIESWFDDKFILVFNKHFDNKEPDVLKGFIITSLQRFKNRILRKAYVKEGEFYSSRVELDSDENYYMNYIKSDDTSFTDENLFLELTLRFMKDKLNEDAYLLLNTQLNPPPFILDRLNKSNSKITVKVLLEFFGLESNNRNIKYINSLKKQIEEAKIKAKEYFNNNPLALEAYV